jgi:hypothetical protein
MLFRLKFLSCVFLALNLLVSLEAAPVPLVNSSDSWFYHKGTNAPQSDWKTVADGGLNGPTWITGQGGFGYSTDNPGELVDSRTTLGDMQNLYTTVYLRKSFQVSADPAPNQHLLLNVDWDDGFIAWLDGVYLTNMLVTVAPAEPANDAVANSNHESSHGNAGNNPQPAMTFDLGVVGSRLTVGTHTLAIIGLNSSKNSSDFLIVPNLYLDIPPAPPSNSLSGTISVDTTLFASNSPYNVTGNLTIANNATFRIEPGTTLQLASTVSLTVSSMGRLLAEGTAEAPIRIVKPTPASPAWASITINGTAGSPENRLAHVYLEGNSSRCLTVTAGTVVLDHVTFGTTNYQYLALDGASFLVTDCYFPGSTSGFEPVHGTLGIKAGGRGIIQNCFFGPISGYCDTIDFTGGNRPGPIVQFLNNVFMGTGDDNLDLDSTDAWVQGNIFLHVHKNGSPDTSSAVSGGNDDGNTSGVTAIENIFYDCDHAAMAKQGNLFALINNTIVRQTHQGGLDTEGALLCLQDNNMTEGRGMYLEANVIYDIEKLTRNVTNGIVTFQNNLMPLPWPGPGSGNSTANPMLTYVPQLAETFFTNWADAQVMKQWFRLLPGSPALGTGPNGADKGGVIPMGVSLSGAPGGTTTNTSATLVVGVNRSGGAIPVSDWPNGAGYTHYRWRLDTNNWSAEIPIATPITLSGLASGPHYVEVIGKNDAGFYQDAPDFGANATVTRSQTWYVQSGHPDFRISAIESTGDGVLLRFPVISGNTYTVQFNTTLDGSAPWQTLSNLPPVAVSGEFSLSDPTAATQPRFYRVVTPAQP